MKSPSPSWHVEWHANITSTMERATDLAEAGAPSGTVVVADYQARGRGTHGREWWAQPGTCLMFTAILRPSIRLEELPQLPQQIALSIADLLREQFGLQADLSPPNDIEIDGRKICGVLCASRITGERLHWVLCGVGLNSFMTVDQLPLSTATSLVAEGIEDIPTHPELLELVLACLGWLLDRDRASCAGYADKPIL